MGMFSRGLSSKEMWVNVYVWVAILKLNELAVFTVLWCYPINIFEKTLNLYSKLLWKSFLNLVNWKFLRKFRIT